MQRAFRWLSKSVRELSAPLADAICGRWGAERKLAIVYKYVPAAPPAFATISLDVNITQRPPCSKHGSLIMNTVS